MHSVNVSDRRASRAARAFTLVEVLVVVAIIALLIAILMPSLKAARRQARLAACLSNMKSIGSSMSMYAGGYKGWLPVGPADRIGYIDPVSKSFSLVPLPGYRPWPSFNCAWGGKRAKVTHDIQDPPRPEVLKRPLSDYIYHRVGLDGEMPLFQCPDDIGGALPDKFQNWISGDFAQYRRESMYDVCGNSYWTNPWDDNKPISKKRYKIPAAIIVAEEAPMYHSMQWGEQITSWHGQFSKHNMVFLDFHAANLYVNPRGLATDPHRWQGPGWYAANYFEIMDYYR